MSCNCNNLTGGITKGCENSQGGITHLYITEKCNVTSITLASPSNEISAFNMAGSPAAVFYEFEFNKNSSTYTEVTVADQAKGTQVTTQTITLKLRRREKSKRDTIALLTYFKDLVAVVKDSNGLYFYLGEANGLNVTENNSQTGTAKADENGYTITFVGEEPYQANTVEAAAIEAVI